MVRCEGGIALQILKSYYRCSNALLVEQINGNWQAQMFCGILLLRGEQIKDKDIGGRWRSYLGQHLDMDKLQMDCVSHWKPYMEHIHTGFSDATVYESYIEYPTDAKLLWKSCCAVLQMIRTARKKVKLRDTRLNHEKRKRQYLLFAKRRKKSKRLSRKTCKWLLKYLQRLIEQLGSLLQKHTLGLSASQAGRLRVINKLKEQQWQWHFGKQAKVPDRIVSLHKPYVRPIIRGKEVKPVEFGAKVNMLLFCALLISKRLKPLSTLTSYVYVGCPGIFTDRFSIFSRRCSSGKSLTRVE